jgi:hypothetical protein
MRGDRVGTQKLSVVPGFGREIRTKTGSGSKPEPAKMTGDQIQSLVRAQVPEPSAATANASCFFVAGLTTRTKSTASTTNSGQTR